MNKISTLILILFSLIISACSYSYTYSFELINKASYTVKVDFETNDIDTTYTIDANQSKVILISPGGREGRGGPFYSDVNTFITSLTIGMNDSLYSTKNYLDNNSWDYNEGYYSAVITDSEFQ